uniref:DUF429 domain-containing protein n=1 Tax=Eiseniibacteriota bacterium TaxID=2212470 RepID=A0A832I4P7_UNCEI
MRGPVAVHGVDWSGAALAGRHIWIASGWRARRGLEVTAVVRASDLPGGGVERAAALAAVRAFVAARPGEAVGIDAPLGLPRALAAADWQSTVRAVARDRDAGAFRARCAARTGGREPRRACDVAARTPFAPTNLRLYRQTFHALAGLVAPLLEAGRVRVAPMQRPAARAALLLEVCPASTLAREGLRVPYKGRGGRLRDARARIAAALAGRGLAARIACGAREAAVEDPGGDALDAVVACCAAARAVADARALGRANADERLEGRVYV